VVKHVLQVVNNPAMSDVLISAAATDSRLVIANLPFALPCEHLSVMCPGRDDRAHYFLTMHPLVEPWTTA
jgi:hypothetical protein